MSEENKALVRRFFEYVWNNQDLDALDAIYAPDVEDHGLPPGLPPGIAGSKMYLGMFMSAFPDAQITVEAQTEEGDRIVTRWTGTGTHAGELMGIPATGKRVTVSGIYISRIAEGQIVEIWGDCDRVSLMQQLGEIASPDE